MFLQEGKFLVPCVMGWIKWSLKIEGLLHDGQLFRMLKERTDWRIAKSCYGTERGQK